MRRSLLLVVLACTLFTMSAAANSGLNYSYYEGSWSTIPDFTGLTPVKSGTSSNFDIGVRNRDTYYAILWQGFITIPSDGIYTFETSSDDGSKLFIGNYSNSWVPLVNNDGLHGTKSVSTNIYLTKGIYPISASFLQATAAGVMQVYWSSNTGISRQLIPDNVLSSNYSGTVSSYSGLNYTYTEGVYANMPNFASSTKLKTGNSANIDLGVRNRDTYYAILWEGYITIPANGTYTFETSSDDGSKLYIGSYNNGNSPLVNNDGNHGTVSRTGSIYLSAGVYPISISFFQGVGDQVMNVYWSSNTGISRQQIPSSAFTTSAGTVAPPVVTQPSTGSGPINWKYYQGNFSGSLPDMLSLTPDRTGTSSTFDLTIQNRNAKYAIMWQSNITIPASGTYTFETNSDDGSKLFIGDFNNSVTPVVNNDGDHGQQIRTGNIYLNAGIYPITVLYYQNTGGQSIDVYYSSNAGLARQIIPASAFTTSAATSAPVVTPPTPPTPVTTPDTQGSSNESGGLTGSRNFYVSSTSGDDNRSNNDAQNPSTPWRTLNKVASVITSLQAGDAILFKRGETFEGSLNITRSGSGSNPIIFSAYGTGTKPVISGFTTLGNWVNQGNNVWSSYYGNAGSKVNMVTINGQTYQMGRFPNATSTSKNYMAYTQHTFDPGSRAGSYFIPQLSGSWTGGEAVIRKLNWIIDRSPITNQSGQWIATASPSQYEGTNGFGLYIQNHRNTLDQFGEWYYDPNSKNLYMHFAGNNPGSYTVKESVIENLITVGGQSNITFDNLSFQGANTKAMEITSSTNIKLLNCTMYFSGMNAINANFCTNFDMENCDVEYTNNNCLYLAPGMTNAIIKNNKISATGLFPGMGGSGDDSRQAMVFFGSNSTVSFNEIDSTGYSAIKFGGNNVTVSNNFVYSYCLTTDDGAGIYTNDRGYTGRKILNNIVMNGVGATEGTAWAVNQNANGIGADDYSTDVTISGNSVGNCNGRGIGIHNAHELTITGNTVFNCEFAQMEMNHDILGPNDPIRNLTLTDNIFVSKKPGQVVLTARTKDNDISQFGNFNNNYYARPMDDNATMEAVTNTASNGIWNTYSLGQWKSIFGIDGNSKKSLVSIANYVNPDDYMRMEYNPSVIAKTISLDGVYTDVKGNIFNYAITLQPYTSAVLFKKGNSLVQDVLNLLSTTGTNSNAVTEATAADKVGALSLKVTPNPAVKSIQLNMSLPQTDNNKATLSIFSASGTMISTRQLTVINNQPVTIDISTLGRGVYTINLTSGKNVISKQFVKL